MQHSTDQTSKDKVFIVCTNNKATSLSLYASHFDQLNIDSGSIRTFAIVNCATSGVPRRALVNGQEGIIACDVLPIHLMKSDRNDTMLGAMTMIFFKAI